MVTLGIDPGSIRAGLAVVKDGELVHTSTVAGEANDPASFYNFFEQIELLIQTHAVDYLMYEGQFAKNNIDTLVKIARSTGVIVAVAGKHQIPTECRMPNSWRKIFHDVYGKVEKGNPSKRDTFRVVKERFGVVTSFNKDNDIADAIGIAYAMYLLKKGDGDA